MSEPVISVEGLSKAFQIYQKPVDMMMELVTKKRRHDLFWALKNISFEVNEHDRIGIIGANGSGKSTLLKIIAGNLQPTSGKAVVRGNISAMLSLATSLNPEETGLSNIRFNLMLNGCPKSRIPQVTEEIIEFTELGAFIYQPVKTYSSGMNAKLSFGIATAIEPEVLIVDEVLSVGDGYFVSKAMKRMVSLCERGKALLFVSHATGAVQLLCNKVIWMENGAIRMIGPSTHVLKLYEEDFRRREDELSRSGNMTKMNEMEGSGRSEDLLSSDLVKLRLVANGGGPFHDTHYVRRLVCTELASGVVISDLELIDSLDRDEQRLGLDLYNSEWGRGFQRHGSNCRVLSPRTGKFRGGHFAIQMLPEYGDGTKVQIEVESQGLSGGEHLVAESLSYETGNWVQGHDVSEEQLEGGWSRVRGIITFKAVDATRLALTRALLAQRALPQVEIVDVDLLSDGVSTRVITERVPFSIVVKVHANRPTELADVSIKIMRSDGVYVFWQSSGMVGENLHNISGSQIVRFDFSANKLGAGSYQLSAYTANGWSYPENYPYSEVFDRKVSCCQFTVVPETPALDFGVLNLRVPVRVSPGDQN